MKALLIATAVLSMMLAAPTRVNADTPGPWSGWAALTDADGNPTGVQWRAQYHHFNKHMKHERKYSWYIEFKNNTTREIRFGFRLTAASVTTVPKRLGQAVTLKPTRGKARTASQYTSATKGQTVKMWYGHKIARRLQMYSDKKVMCVIGGKNVERSISAEWLRKRIKVTVRQGATVLLTITKGLGRISASDQRVLVANSATFMQLFRPLACAAPGDSTVFRKFKQMLRKKLERFQNARCRKSPRPHDCPKSGNGGSGKRG